MKKLATAALALALALTALTASPAGAETSESGYTLYFPETGTSVPVEDIGSMSNPTKSRPLNPISIGLCNAGQKTHVIGSQAAGVRNNINLGVIDLKCGTSTAGYVHIRERHQKDWSYFTTKYPIGGTWDDFMWFATKSAIATPAAQYGMPKRIGKTGKVCYSTNVQIKNPKGIVMDSLNPSVIVSENNKYVITSIPTSNSPHCK